MEIATKTFQILSIPTQANIIDAFLLQTSSLIFSFTVNSYFTIIFKGPSRAK